MLYSEAKVGDEIIDDTLESISNTEMVLLTCERVAESMIARNSPPSELNMFVKREKESSAESTVSRAAIFSTSMVKHAHERGMIRKIIDRTRYGEKPLIPISTAQASSMSITMNKNKEIPIIHQTYSSFNDDLSVSSNSELYNLKCEQVGIIQKLQPSAGMKSVVSTDPEVTNMLTLQTAENSELFKPRKRKADGETVLCQQCRQVVTKKHSRGHASTHLKIRRVRRCTLCSKMFHRISRAYAHLHRDHKGDPSAAIECSITDEQQQAIDLEMHKCFPTPYDPQDAREFRPKRVYWKAPGGSQLKCAMIGETKRKMLSTVSQSDSSKLVAMDDKELLSETYERSLEMHRNVDTRNARRKRKPTRLFSSQFDRTYQNSRPFTPVR